jgi:hypothetical protein
MAYACKQEEIKRNISGTEDGQRTETGTEQSGLLTEQAIISCSRREPSAFLKSNTRLAYAKA